MLPAANNIPPTQHPGSLSDVPLTIVTTVEQLQEISRLLVSVSEFAVDLEVSYTSICLNIFETTKSN